MRVVGRASRKSGIGGVLAGLTLSLALVSSMSARAQNAVALGRERATPEPDVVAFVLGNIEFLLIHEIAHFLISEKQIPIVGPVENAADYIATLALIREEPLDPSQKDRALKDLVAAADAFSLVWQNGSTTGAQAPYWGTHALSIQRYYQIACLLYGSDPIAFARVPEVAGLPPVRAAGCIDEFARADKAIDWLLATFGRHDGDPPGAATEVSYGPPPTLVGRRIVEALRSSELLERTLERLRQRFVLDSPFTLSVRSCGEAEAAWLPEQREMVICYELIDTLYLLGIQERTRHLDPALPPR
jgi:Putative metallopeptidase